MVFCTRCGASVDLGAEFCAKCGARLTPAEPVSPVTQETGPPPATPIQPSPAPWAAVDPNAKSKIAAGLLGIFLGWLGIHRFYLGYTNIGLAQLALGLIGLVLSPVTCGLIVAAASVWGLVDGIMILTGAINKDGQGRPLRD